MVHSPGDSRQGWKPKSRFLHPSGIRRSHISCFWLLTVPLGYGHISVACSHHPVLALTQFFPPLTSPPDFIFAFWTPYPVCSHSVGTVASHSHLTLGTESFLGFSSFSSWLLLTIKLGCCFLIIRPNCLTQPLHWSEGLILRKSFCLFSPTEDEVN